MNSQMTKYQTKSLNQQHEQNRPNPIQQHEQNRPNPIPLQFQQQKLPQSIVLQIHHTEPMTQPSSPSQQKVSFLFSQLYESHRYYSPYHMSVCNHSLTQTEEQLIDDIHSLGDQILYFQDQSVIVDNKDELHQIIRDYKGSLERKNYRTGEMKRSKGRKVQKGKSEVEKGFKLRGKKSNSPDMVKNQVKPALKRQIMTTKALREKTIQKLNRSKQQQLKASLTKSPLKPKPQTPKLKSKSKINPSPKFLENLEYDYKKFIDKNIPKIVNQLRYQKEVLQPNNGQKFGNPSQKNQKKKDLMNQTQISKEISTFTEEHSLKTSRQKLNQTFSTLYTNYQTMLQRKQQKIENFKQELFKKQMKQATFQPKRFTLSYKPKSTYVNQNSSLKNFYQRQKVTQQTKNKRQLEKLSEIMEECPFKPRLNVNSRQADSIVKEIWRSTSKETKRQLKQQKISDKLSKMTKGLKKDHQRLSQAHLEKQRPTKQPIVQISINSRNQLNFLLQ